MSALLRIDLLQLPVLGVQNHAAVSSSRAYYYCYSYCYCPFTPRNFCCIAALLIRRNIVTLRI